MRHFRKIIPRPFRRFWFSLRKSRTGFNLSSYSRWPIRTAAALWRGLREWCGDAAYESYLRSKALRSGSSSKLSPAEFYVEQLNRKYSRPNRCC
jgi:hypothetical protein